MKMNKKFTFMLLISIFISTSAVILISGCLNEEKNTGLQSLQNGTENGRETQKVIFAFCGSVSKPPLEEAAKIFEEKTGIKVEFNFGGSGMILSQMKLSRQGDLYIPGSHDYMRIAERDNIIYPETIKRIAYLIPTINVQKGNPKNIQSLEDLTKKGIKIGICAPKSCCVGLYGVEIFEFNNISEKVKPNIVVHAKSCADTASLIRLDKVDAVMGWDVFSKWNSNEIETVYLKPEQIPRIAYIPAAVSTYTKDRESAQKFIDFLVSDEGRAIFKKWGYVVTEDEARKYGPNAQIGGEYQLPSSWNV